MCIRDSCAEDGVLFSADQSTLIRYPQAREETGYVVPDACRTLADWSFIGASTLEQIDLNQVTAIGEDCFYYCTALKNIAVPDGVTQLNGAVFAHCTSLEQVTLPDTMQTLGDYCFYSDVALADINIPDGVTQLGEKCFYNCGALLELSLPASITEIGEKALGYYTNADGKDDQRIDKLNIRNGGSAAVRAYERSWKHASLWKWLLAGGIAVAAAGGITAIVLVHRSRNRIRTTTRQASATKPGKRK